MKKFSTTCNHENVINLFAQDSLGRRQQVIKMANFICNTAEQLVIALDGQWGSGKTFFIRQLQLLLDAYNDKSVLSDNSRSKIKNAAISEIKNLDPVNTFYFDAWEHDGEPDPLQSIIAALYNSSISNYKFDNSETLFNTALIALDLVTNRNSIGTIKQLSDVDNPISDIEKYTRIRDKINQFIDSLVANCDKLVILIDELDRCNPIYAIKLLETIKHYFDNDKIVIIFAINLVQLQHTIRAYYGNDFDASLYLERFFDIQLSILPTSPEKYVAQYLGHGRLSNTCQALSRYHNMSLREIERFVSATKFACGKYFDETKFPEDVESFIILYFAPIAFALSIVDKTGYEKFVSGRGRDIIVGYDDCYRVNETMLYMPSNTVVSIGHKEIVNRTVEAYDALFTYDKDGSFKTVGKLTFDESTIEFFHKVIAFTAYFIHD